MCLSAGLSDSLCTSASEIWQNLGDSLARVKEFRQFDVCGCLLYFGAVGGRSMPIGLILGKLGHSLQIF